MIVLNVILVVVAAAVLLHGAYVVGFDAGRAVGLGEGREAGEESMAQAMAADACEHAAAVETLWPRRRRDRRPS